MGKRLPVKCLKLCSCCLVAMQFHSWSNLSRRIFKKLCCSPKIKLKDCVQQIWPCAEFHKYAQLVECSLIWIQFYWNKWFVNPQSTDFYNKNWNKVINAYLVIKKKKKKNHSRSRTHLRGQCCTTAGNWSRHRWAEKVRWQEAMYWSLRSSTGVTDEKKKYQRRWRERARERECERARERERCSLNQAVSSGISN